MQLFCRTCQTAWSDALPRTSLFVQALDLTRRGYCAWGCFRRFGEKSAYAERCCCTWRSKRLGSGPKAEPVAQRAVAILTSEQAAFAQQRQDPAREDGELFRLGNIG
ncbi:hypothetical protein [Bradyrhizobium sp. CER78]|uniref:hypothetical protein n=1 Tax=Bradyrhizobium sp. CER78 TaxID=3039162 RepID=UPI00244CBDDA|nr:hypothetical protein [Bradyrhizobium sp. CER78]MDH2384320.1 hypothetical protein [Bradyrhizobium sp. CER78]